MVGKVQPESWKAWWDRFIGRAAAGGKASGGIEAEKVSLGDGAPSRSGAGPPRAILVLAVIGIGLMLLADGTRVRQEAAQEAAAGAGAFSANAVVTAVPVESLSDVEGLERELTLAIGQMAGVGNVEVLIVPSASEVRVLAEEVTERRSSLRGEGGQAGATIDVSLTRRPVIVRNDADDREEPIVLYTEKPRLAGVLVVADGASDPEVRWMLMKAVSTVLDVPAHRVEIVPRK